jgi:hypothetical protein
VNFPQFETETEVVMSSNCVVPPVIGSGLTYVPDEIILYGMDLVSSWDPSSSPLLGFARIRPNSNVDGEKWDIYILAGLQIPEDAVIARTKGQKIEFEVLMKAITTMKTSKRFAAVYGYAYEGACYRLDKPKILAFESNGNPAPAVGCGFEDEELNYTMWRVRASDMLVEMTVNSDTFQKLILEQNLPGKRAPNTYAATMIQGGVVHRGGRLMES